MWHIYATDCPENISLQNRYTNSTNSKILRNSGYVLHASASYVVNMTVNYCVHVRENFDLIVIVLIFNLIVNNIYHTYVQSNRQFLLVKISRK